MDCPRKIYSLLKTRQKDEQRSFLENGSAVLEELIVSFNGKHNIPIRNFSAKEISKATNDFTELVLMTGTGSMFRGIFGQCPVIIKTFRDGFGFTSDVTEAAHDMVITSQLSLHRNVLRLFGCCLEFKLPCMVYEFAGTKLLSKLLSHCKDGNTKQDDHQLLSWQSRIRIAKGIANVVVYLHTAFPTPIVHRDIKLENVIIDGNGVVKLFDFSLCVSLPPGELQINEGRVVGRMGYLAPEYTRTGTITTKIDVYCFGLILFQLLTGKQTSGLPSEVMPVGFIDCVKQHVEKGQFREVLDPRILENGEWGVEKENKLKACLALSLSCIQDNAEDRPEMIDVAKELRQIERAVYAIN